MKAKILVASLAAMAIMICSMLSPLPAMASDHAHYPITFGTMSNKIDATAKDAEGRLESAYGELTGDTGHQIKGKAKQVQASAMNAAEDLKDRAQNQSPRRPVMLPENWQTISAEPPSRRLLITKAASASSITRCDSPAYC